METKRKGGTETTELTIWLAILANAGWMTATEYGLEDCIARLREWGYLQ